MSRAFVREQDGMSPDAPPELKIGPHPNFVTPRGLRLIDKKLSEVEAALATTDPEAPEAARLRRDQRYWSTRKATAQVVEPGDVEADEVAFGTRVTFRRQGRKDVETIEIVGQDEADPAQGRLSFVAPLAAALMGAQAGDEVEIGTRTPPLMVTVLSVEPIDGGLVSRH